MDAALEPEENSGLPFVVGSLNSGAPPNAMPEAKPTYQELVDQARCTRCGVEAADGADLCEEHLDDKRQRQRKWIAKVREERIERGECVWCPASRVAKATAGDTSCLACRIRRRRVRPDGGVDNGVDKRSRLNAATRTHGDGRTRYHGQQKRGSQPRQQLNDQDLGFARAALTAGETGLRLLETPEVRAMPPIQRDDVKHAALHQLGRAVGHIEDVQERMGHFKVRHGRRGSE